MIENNVAIHRQSVGLFLQEGEILIKNNSPSLCSSPAAATSQQCQISMTKSNTIVSTVTGSQTSIKLRTTIESDTQWFYILKDST